MGIQVYSTLTRKKEAFETLEPNKVRLYVCGPTVYDKAHVGHAMSALVFRHHSPLPWSIAVIPSNT